jgi:hypothetical protein
MAHSQHIHKTIDLSHILLLVADDGEKECNQDECLVFFGVVRDCAYKIQAAAAMCCPGSGDARPPAVGSQSGENHS